MKTIDRIAVIGLGYVGLPTAALFAAKGLQVLGVDTNEAAVDSINAGRPHFGEPDLDSLLCRVVQDGKLSASTCMAEADAFVLAVPTPLGHGRRADMQYVEAAARSLAPVLRPGNLVILESTSPVGATEQLSRWLAEARPDLGLPHDQSRAADISIAHCPERVLPGRVIQEVVNNARVIGGITAHCAEHAASLYRLIIKGECRLTDARTAELAKLSENAFRDVNIAFANELAQICDRHDIDVWALIELANLHPRVEILRPGPGVGGHCIAVDPWFIVQGAEQDARLISLARTINDKRPDTVCAKVRAQAAGLTRPLIACLGLAYKADVDDLRESPAIKVVNLLAKDDLGELLVVEPHVDVLPPELATHGLTLTDLNTALERADIVLLLVDHSEFRGVDRDRLSGKIIIDTRGVW